MFSVKINNFMKETNTKINYKFTYFCTTKQ